MFGDIFEPRNELNMKKTSHGDILVKITLIIHYEKKNNCLTVQYLLCSHCKTLMLLLNFDTVKFRDRLLVWGRSRVG